MHVPRWCRAPMSLVGARETRPRDERRGTRELRRMACVRARTHTNIHARKRRIFALRVYVTKVGPQFWRTYITPSARGSLTRRKVPGFDGRIDIPMERPPSCSSQPDGSAWLPLRCRTRAPIDDDGAVQHGRLFVRPRDQILLPPTSTRHQFPRRRRRQFRSVSPSPIHPRGSTRDRGDLPVRRRPKKMSLPATLGEIQ